jgi:hypothetical protein
MANTKLTKKEQEEQELAIIGSFEQDAGLGAENIEAADQAMPFLRPLQKMSPQVDEDNPAYNESAKAGMFFNTATERLYDEVTFLPVYYERCYIEWQAREQGGGFLGKLTPIEAKARGITRGEDGKDYFDNGNQASDTRELTVIIINGDGTFDPAVISMSSSQVKASRKLMTQLNAVRVKGANGMFAPPMFANQILLNSTQESNDHGTWKGIAFSLDGFVTDQDAYMTAKGLYDAVKGGSKSANYSEGEGTPVTSVSDEGTSIPF